MATAHHLAFSLLHIPLTSSFATSMQPLKPETAQELVNMQQAQPEALGYLPLPSVSLTGFSETQSLHVCPLKRCWENKRLFTRKQWQAQ